MSEENAEKKIYTIKGWARLYEEKPREKGGIFTFTHTIWIYETKWEADGKELDKEATCLGLFPICIEIDREKRILTFINPNLLPPVLQGETVAHPTSDTSLEGDSGASGEVDGSEGVEKEAE